MHAHTVCLLSLKWIQPCTKHFELRWHQADVTPRRRFTCIQQCSSVPSPPAWVQFLCTLGRCTAPLSLRKGKKNSTMFVLVYWTLNFTPRTKVFLSLTCFYVTDLKIVWHILQSVLRLLWCVSHAYMYVCMRADRVWNKKVMDRFMGPDQQALISPQLAWWHHLLDLALFRPHS